MSQLPLHEIIDAPSLTYHLENTPLGVIIWDNNDCIAYWSKRAAEIFEWTEEEALHQNVSMLNLVHPEDADSVATTVDDIKAQRIYKNHQTNRNITKSGRVIY